MTHQEAITAASSETSLVRSSTGWAIEFGLSNLTIEFPSLRAARMCLFITRAVRAAQMLLATQDLALTQIALRHQGSPQTRLSHIMEEYKPLGL